jgi:hypothetical protein
MQRLRLTSHLSVRTRSSRFFRFVLPSASVFWLFSLGLAMAHNTTISHGNSTFVLNHGEPSIVGSLPYTGEWFVDGRRILTYVSSPANLIDISPHHHSDGHVSSNQMHVAGQLLGGPARGGLDISGSIVYTLYGSVPGSGVSRLIEFVELTMGPTAEPTSLNLTGFGFKPQGSYEIPDLSGLQVIGTTLAYATKGSFSVGPFD